MSFQKWELFSGSPGSQTENTPIHLVLEPFAFNLTFSIFCFYKESQVSKF